MPYGTSGVGRSVGRVGVGGLDSSTVLHYAAKHCAGRLKTFSFLSPGGASTRAGIFGKWRGLRHGPPRVRPEPGHRVGERHTGFRVLLRRTQRGRRGAAGVVSVADEPAPCDGRAFRGGRGRAFWRIRDVPGRSDGAAVSPDAGPVPKADVAALERYVPVSDDKISLEYKLKRWIEGSWLDPDEAHFFWNGTFSPAQLACVRPGTRGSGLKDLVSRLKLNGRGWWTATCGWIRVTTGGRHTVQDGIE